MYCPLKITTDYSLLSSLIKINDLVNKLKDYNITSCAICDNNLYGVLDFYFTLKKNDIKPIIGLNVLISNKNVYVYAKNYKGYQKLLKLHTKMQEDTLDINDLKDDNLKVIIPYESKDLFVKDSNFYLGYKKETEKIELLELTKNLVYVNNFLALKKEDTPYIEYLDLIANGLTKTEITGKYKDNYLTNPKELDKEDIMSTLEFSSDLNLEIPLDRKYIPKYYKSSVDSYDYLKKLALTGLNKRFHNNPSAEYKSRLKYELDVIHNMGFVDYFLIVYDYVFYAKKNNILVGPGRGSAAGSLVSFCLGITEVDPLKYNLLFERFLNPDRITMPDIDIDFDFEKRNDVINYVKETYGYTKVAPIMTFGTLASKQVLRDIGKILGLDQKIIDKFVKVIDPHMSLKYNLKRDIVKSFLKNYADLKELYQICFKFEGIKRHISTHAAGIVICSEDLDNIIPIHIMGQDILCGVTMEYLESVGLLKMDFLALRNLSIISNVLKLIDDKSFNLNNISYEDKKVYDLFSSGLTEGIFQFESSGMKNLITKFKPRNFDDLVACIAIFRPGPMANIDTFIKRKNNEEKVTYLNDDLKEILSPTWGIIIYQEQIMQILVKMASFSYAEADNIRRAMSKKKKDIILKAEEKFINNSIKNGYSKKNALEVYNLILKFANYGFNKAHSVSYAKIAYQMAYLKVYYKEYFICNLLNMSIGSEIKTKEYLDEAKKSDLSILAPDINKSDVVYKVIDNKLLLPLLVIKNLGQNIVSAIMDERKSNGLYADYLDFVSRTYKLGVNKLVLESLINSGSLDSLDYNRHTKKENIPLAINYASLMLDDNKDLDLKPEFVILDEDDEDTKRLNEYDSLGFYLTNHPASKYTKGVVKSREIDKYFDKVINLVGLIDKIHNIKTKKNDDMAFITLSDEYGNIDITVFPNKFNLISDFQKGDLVGIIGKVTKRFASYSVTLNDIKKIG